MPLTLTATDAATTPTGAVCVVAGSAAVPPDPAHTIVSIVDLGDGTLFVTTAADHGLAGGESIVISGTSVAAYNGPWTVDSSAAPFGTVFHIAAAVYTADATGGEWGLA